MTPTPSETWTSRGTSAVTTTPQPAEGSHVAEHNPSPGHSAPQLDADDDDDTAHHSAAATIPRPMTSLEIKPHHIDHSKPNHTTQDH